VCTAQTSRGKVRVDMLRLIRLSPFFLQVWFLCLAVEGALVLGTAFMAVTDSRHYLDHFQTTTRMVVTVRAPRA
jgi:hypothetical protein